MNTSSPLSPNLDECAQAAYRELVASLARGEERGLAELLTITAAAGKTTEDLARDVDGLDLDRPAGDGNPHNPETT